MGLQYLFVGWVSNVFILEIVTAITIGFLPGFIKSSITLIILINNTLSDVFKSNNNFIIQEKPKNIVKFFCQFICLTIINFCISNNHLFKGWLLLIQN